MSVYVDSLLSGGRARRSRSLRRAWVTAAAALSAVFLMVFVWQRVQAVKLGYEVEELKKERAELAGKNELLKVEVAALASPERIERIATGQLGMVVPSDSQMVLVRRLHKGAGTAPDAAGRKAELPSGRTSRARG